MTDVTPEELQELIEILRTLPPMTPEETAVKQRIEEALRRMHPSPEETMKNVTQPKKEED